MNLVPFSKQYLRLNEALPFGLRDAAGRLLLAAGSRVDRADVLEELQSAELYADEGESSDWRRRLGGAIDAMLLRNAPLGRIADARPQPMDDDRAAARQFTLRFGEQWDELCAGLDGLLRDPGADRSWQQRLQARCDAARTLSERRLDDSLYHLIYGAGHSTESYSSHHALLCFIVARETARLLEWDADLIGSLERAALTMNLSIRRLQDMLAAHAPTMTAAMRAELDQHPAKSAQMLANAGVTDLAWLEIVQLHHDDSRKAMPLSALSGPQQAARLLRRVDIFTAKLSRRATRVPSTPVQAAREACIGADGVPDEIGGALLKAVGLYPPGSFVALANGEIGIVIGRGRRANLPLVAALVAASGAPMGTPALRDTLDKRYAVKSAVSVDKVKVIPPHDRLMMMR
ncbi:HD-GYP domain-containing protein [Aquabacterium sp.]|uniref:HD-GYP domain-containing protein n=1 Tax=Aquabacterium sp. TaxID=1872578 RepID=UPI0037833793